MSIQNLDEQGTIINKINSLGTDKLFIEKAWDYRRDDESRFMCVAEKRGIIICRYEGWSIKSDYTRLGEVIEDVIVKLSWQQQPWILIYDCSRLEGMDIAARGKLIDLLRLQKNLKGVVFNSPSHLVKSLVQLAVIFYSLSFHVKVCVNLQESYHNALEWLELPQVNEIKEEYNIENTVSNNGGKYNKEIDAVLKILGEVEWNKPGVDFLENAARNSSWKPFINMMAIIKGDLDIMIQRREERLAELERNNLNEISLQQKKSQALEASQKAKVAFEQESKRNMMLTRVVVDTQKEILFSMGEIIESRSRETANHIRRVAEYSTLMSKLCGQSEREQQHILHASPMHDAGKIAIPDSILNKPGKLTDEEFTVMKSHAQIGYEMLSGSQLEIMQLAAIIACQHHEKWNGKGYPQGLKGEGIHTFGRIVALADVFDALGSDRCYKKAWPLEKILELLQTERGAHFDPVLIDLFFKNMDGFLAIRERFPDATT
jgi:response regulator RpfG family c-di-GMP phosphodiesterase